MAEDTLIHDAKGPLIWINPERMSGAPCFYGTRLPVKTLFEYLESNYTVDDFLDCFPSANRQLVVRVLEHSGSTLPHTPSLRATPLHRGDPNHRSRRSPLERGARRAGCGLNVRHHVKYSG